MAPERTPEMTAALRSERNRIMALVREVEKVVVGKHNEVVMLVAALLAGGHVLIEDVPGVGKTTLASAIAKAAGLKFNRAQFTPDVLASDITGFNVYNRSKETFEFREGLVMCNILLADEINRASPKTQSALLEAMEEGHVTVDGERYEIPSPFIVIATQNPAGYVGTYPLPEAQMDRFMIKLSMGYPSEDEEIEIMLKRGSGNPLDKIETVLEPEDIASAGETAAKMELSPEVSRYIVKLVGATRKSDLLSLGASPRASIALMKMCRTYALLRGKDYVSPEDVAAVYGAVLSHRIVLGQNARLEGMTAAEALDKIARKVPVPYRRERT